MCSELSPSEVRETMFLLLLAVDRTFVKDLQEESLKLSKAKLLVFYRGTIRKDLQASV